VVSGNQEAGCRPTYGIHLREGYICIGLQRYLDYLTSCGTYGAGGTIYR